MNAVRRIVLVIAALAAPASAYAQATLAGVIRDASGGVLPGTTVEVASPVLIEKTRAAISDATGQYRITELPPGTYAVTFSLTGFSTVQNYGTGSNYLAPMTMLTPRFVRFNVTVDF